MTSHKEHIQTLIAEIDTVLQRTNPRLPWVMSGEVAQQRQMLERVRNFLVALQQTLPMPDGMRPPLDGVQSLAAQMGGYPAAPSGGPTADMTPYEMMQTILQEVSYLRANLPPASLQQAPSNQSQLTAELLQVLMSRLQENLSQQIAQTLDQIRLQTAHPAASPLLSGGLSPVPQYEQLQNLRSRSDQMLVNLDSTLNVVFESLQRNIQSYQEALSQGLERMYSMGQQSEYTLKQLIEHLTQQLKQEASSYLLPTPAAELPAPAPLTAPPPATPGVAPPSPVSPNPAFPYAGAELLSSEISGSDSPPPPQSFAAPTSPPDAVPPLDTAIASWLQSVSAMNLDDTPPETALLPDLPPLDLSDLDLGTADFPAMLTTANELTAPPPEFSFTSVTPGAPPPAPPAGNPATVASAAIAEDDTADIDAVLKLLEDLSAEVETSAQAASLEDAEAQLEQILSVSPPPSGEAQPGDLPEDAREELDEFLQDDFYQSLFGSETAIAPDPVTPAPPAVSLDDLFDLAPPQPTAAAAAVVSPAEETFAAFGLDLETEPTSGSLFDLQLPQDSETTPSLYLELPADLFDPNPSFASNPSPDSPNLTPPPLTLTPLELPGSEQPPDSAIADLLQSLPGSDRAALEPELGLPAEATTADPPATAQGEALPATSFYLEPASTPVPPPLDAPGDSLTTWFQAVTEAATRSIPIEPPGARPTPPVVSTRNEPAPLFLGNDLFGKEPAPEPNEDQFTRAASDESLIPNPALAQSGVSLEVDDLTLSSLSEDLFSLEGQSPQPTFTLSDFAEATSNAAVSPPAIAPDPAVDDLSLDSFAADLAAPAAPAVPFYQASPAIENLSMEGFADLFGSAPTPSSVPAPAPAPTEALPFTLNPTANLFETPPPPPDAPALPSVESEPSPFTLEGMDDLFGDAPAISRRVAPPSLPVTPPSSEIAQPAAEPFTLDGMHDLFANVPPSAHPSASQVPPPVVPPVTLPADEGTPARGIPPFKPELFHPDDVMEPLPDFQLERLDNLFADAAPAVEPPPAAPLADHQTLDAAFESLLGTPPPVPPTVRPAPTSGQKKKTP